MKKFLKEFKAFAMKGNVLDMAVGIIIGSAFTAIVNSLVNDIIMPVIGAITGGVNFTEYKLTVGTAEICWGNFIQAVVNFLLISIVVFLVVKGINTFREKLDALAKKEEEAPASEAPAEPSEDILLLREIRDSLKKQ